MSTLREDLPRPRHVDVDGVAVATYELPSREPSAGDVVLCHGTPWSARVWATVARLLSRDHRVLLWDMPGYGRSPMSEDVALDLPRQGARLAALVAAWCPEQPPHVVAHDIGGAVALGAHLREGVEFASLFCWDVVALEPWGSPFFTLVADHAPVFSALPPRLHAALVREYVRGAAPGRLSDEDVEVLAAPWCTDDGQPAFYRQVAALRPEHTRPLVERLDQVRCPAAVGWGQDDPWLPVAQAEELDRRLPAGTTVTTLEGVAHLAPVEDPSRVAATVRAWLEAQRPLTG